MGATAMLAMSCLLTLSPVAGDSVPPAESFARTPCPHDAVATPWRYDGGRKVTVASRALTAGEILRPYPEFGVAMLRPGDKVRLVSTAGAVRVERDVEALQPARPGERLFVRSGDGEVMSVRYEEVVP